MGGAGWAATNPAPAPVDRREVATGAGVSSAAVLRTDPWVWEGLQGRVMHSRSFSIYTTETDPMIIGRMPGFLDAGVEHYITAITPLPRPTSRLETFVMGDRGQWQRLTLAMLGEQGRTLTYIERGGFAYGGRSFLFDIGAADTLAIAVHEGWHQYTQRTFRDRLPSWAEEGLATLMEGHRWTGNDVVFLPWSNLERFDRLRDAAGKRTLLPLETVLTANPQALMQKGFDAPVTWYAQLWALMHFLREGAGGKYRPALDRLVADAAAGRMGRAMAIQLDDPRASSLLAQRSGLQVFRAYFARDLGPFEAEYRAFITAVIGPGGRNAVVDGRAPAAATSNHNRAP